MTTSETKPSRKLLMTPEWIEALRPESRPIEWRDTFQRGLVLRVEPKVEPKGPKTLKVRKTWVARYRYHGVPRRFTIGTFPETTLAVARTRALKAIGGAQNGNDPQAAVERKRIGEEIKKAVESWKKDEKFGPIGKWKGGLTGGSARSFLPHINALVREHGPKKLAALSARDVERLVSAAPSPASRNRRVTALRTLFKWAKRKGLMEADPLAGLDKETEHERIRTYTDDELRILILGMDSTPYGRAVRLLALNGLRLMEILGAEWSWFDAKAAILRIPPSGEKTGEDRGEARDVLLSDVAVSLFAAQREQQMREGLGGSPFIFATRRVPVPDRDTLRPFVNVLKGRRANGSKRRRAADPRATLLADDVTIHDVRRTTATALLSRVEADAWTVDHVIIGHARTKLARTYMRVLPTAPAREALAKWAALLDSIVAGEAAANTGA